MDQLEELYQDFIDEFIDNIPLVVDRDIQVNQRVINNVYNVRRSIELNEVLSRSHNQLLPALDTIFTSMYEVFIDNTLPEEYEDVKVTISDNEFKKLKCEDVTKEKTELLSKECNICIDTYKEGEEIVYLPCEHIFHKDCIYDWLVKEKVNCPICRCDVRSKTKSK